MAKKKVVKKKATKRVVKKKAVRKKPVSKSVSKKKVVKKTIPVKKNVNRKISTSRYLKASALSVKKSRVALFNLVLFALLSVLCYILYLVSGSGIYQDTFYLLFIVLAFVSLAFLLLFLVFFFAKEKVRK